MAVTRVDLNSDLLHQAKALYGVATNSEAISRALHDVVVLRRKGDPGEAATTGEDHP